VKKTTLKILFLSNIPLAIISLYLGYSFWYIASYDQTIMLQLNVPLCFSEHKNHLINAPEIINVTLAGKRSDLYALEKESLAIHINTNKLLPGKHDIIVADQHLFLPKNVRLVQYKPANLTIAIAQNLHS